MSMKNLSLISVKKFLDKLDNFGTKRLYITAVQKNLDVSKQEALDVIEILVLLDIINPRYQIQIEGQLLPEVYEKIVDIPDSVFWEDDCEDIEVNLEKHVYMFFEVNDNG